MTTKVYTPKPAKTIPVLWEANPPQSDPHATTTGWHGGSNYCVNGYIANGKKRANHLMKNMAAISKAKGENWHYPFDGCISVLEELDFEGHKGLRSHLVEVMESHGIAAAYEMEVTKQNLVNYHFVIREAPEHLMKNRGRKLRDILRKSTTVKLNMQFRATPSYHDCKVNINYISKNVFEDTRVNDKTDDVDAITKGKKNKDIYAHKRVLFRKPPKGVKGQSFHRFGDFGPFWEQSPTASNKQRTQKRKDREAKRLAMQDIPEAAKEWADMTDLPAAVLEDQFHREWESATPAERQALQQQHRYYAERHHGGPEDYGDYQRQQTEQKAIAEQRRKLRAAQPKAKRQAPTIKPFSPADCETFTIGGV